MIYNDGNNMHKIISCMTKYIENYNSKVGRGIRGSDNVWIASRGFSRYIISFVLQMII